MRAHRLLRWISVLFLGAFGLLVLDTMQVLNRYQDGPRAVLAPLSWAASIAVDDAGATWSTISSIGTLQQENRQLRAENAQLVQRNLQLEAAGRDNAALRQLLDFKQANPTHTYHPATIIARGTNNLEPMLTLDQGAKDGVQVGMSVVDAGGLIGRVARVTDHAAAVLPLSNAASAVAVYVNTNNGDRSSTGVVQYEAGGGLLLQFVQATAPLQTGDWVLTSGLGGAFPRDLPVGRIKELRQRPVDLFQIAVLDPASDPLHDRVVLVVTDFVPQAMPQASS